MEDNKGLIVVNKKTSSFLIGCLVIILILSFIYTLKVFQPANSILVTSSIIFYPISFLLITKIYNSYGFKEAKKSIFTSSLIFILFIVLIMIASLFPSGNTTSGYDSIIKYVFVNNIETIGGLNIYYPTLGQFFGLLLAYVTSHLLFITIYNAIKDITNNYLAFGLSLFIACILDRIIFMTLLYLKGLVKGINTFEYFIKCLTSEFIFTILACLIIVILYTMYDLVKRLKKTA